MNPLLLISLLFCHWLADYTHLSTRWMLDAKRIGSPLAPIFAHAFVHSALMLFAILLFGIYKAPIACAILLQLTSHFTIDILKGKCNVWFPVVSNPANKSHWYIFGLDQFLHAVVIIAMTYIVKQ